MRDTAWNERIIKIQTTGIRLWTGTSPKRNAFGIVTVSYTHLDVYKRQPHGNGGGPISTKENRRSCSCVPNLSYISKEEGIKSNKHAIPAFAHVKDFSGFENTGGQYA